jgi:hypothetical protein
MGLLALIEVACLAVPCPNLTQITARQVFSNGSQMCVINSCLFANLTSDFYSGGAVQVSNQIPMANITFSTFVSCSAPYGGSGGACHSSAQLTRLFGCVASACFCGGHGQFVVFGGPYCSAAFELSAILDCGLPFPSAYFGGVAADDSVFLSAMWLNFTRGGVGLDGGAFLIAGTMIGVPDVFQYIGIDNMSGNSLVYLQRPMAVVVGYCNFYTNILIPGGSLFLVEQGTFVVHFCIFRDNYADSEFRILATEVVMEASNTFQVINCVFSGPFTPTFYVSTIGCIDRSVISTWPIPGPPHCSTKVPVTQGFRPSRLFTSTSTFSRSGTMRAKDSVSGASSAPFAHSRTLVRERDFNATVPPAPSGGAQSGVAISFLVGSAVGVVALLSVFGILLAKAWTGGPSKCGGRPKLAPEADVGPAEADAEAPGLYRETQMMDRVMGRAIRSWEPPDPDDTTF